MRSGCETIPRAVHALPCVFTPRPSSSVPSAPSSTSGRTLKALSRSRLGRFTDRLLPAGSQRLMHSYFPQKCFEQPASKRLIVLHPFRVPLHCQEKWLAGGFDQLQRFDGAILFGASGDNKSISDPL